MSLLTPLGLLGLLSLLVLFLIYILKPNYENRVISSTFIWQLSLRYKKKKIPISKIRNILIIIFQVLIFAMCVIMLTQPFIGAEKIKVENENIFIIDASGSMLTENNVGTRYDRAVTQVEKEMEKLFSEGKKCSVIVAGEEPYTLFSRLGKEDSKDAKNLLRGLSSKTDCTYDEGDMEKAMLLAETILLENTEAGVTLYTDTDYIYKGEVDVVLVRDETEYNAAILNGKAELVENKFVFTFDVVSYNKDQILNFSLDIFGVNSAGTKVPYKQDVHCTADLVQKVQFVTENLSDVVYSFEYAYAHIDINDSFTYDNTFYLYGGTAPTLRIQYCSSLRNPYITTVLDSLKNVMQDKWSFEITTLNIKNNNASGGALGYEMTGYDLYIFEHLMPPTLPNDGVVLLLDPDQAPIGSQFVMYSQPQTAPGGNNFVLAEGEKHPLTEGMNPNNITIVEYKRIISSVDYKELMYCGGDPILLCHESEAAKIVVLSLNLNKSNLPLLVDFPILMSNMFNYFFPTTVTGRVYDVYDEIEVNARAKTLQASGPDYKETLENFPATVKFLQPGTYTFSQTLLSMDNAEDSVFVKISSKQSNIVNVEDELTNPMFLKKQEAEDKDLLMWFALAGVILLLGEWLLHSIERA